MKKLSYGLIGRGRVATHLARYLNLENRQVLSWNRRDSPSPEEALSSADFMLLAISDDALEDFLNEHPQLRRAETVHFSGSRSIGGITGLHPLMSFGPEFYDLETYRSIPFIEEKGGLSFTEVFPGLPNPSRALDVEQKALYHALCVLAGNFSALLWMKAFSDFEKNLDLPKSFLLPYLKRVAANLVASPDEALSGPLIRGDMETIRIDREALADDPWQRVFSSFVDVFETRGVHA